MSINLPKKVIDPAKSFKMTEEQTIAAEESMNAAMALQKELGLGDSTVAGARLLNGCKAAKAVKALIKDFKFIDEPSEEDFPRFIGGDTATCGKSFAKAPKYAMVRLSAGTKGLSAQGQNRESYTADIPIMPTTCLSLAKRVGDVAPNAEFHLIFEPEWTKQPQRDPVLVAKIAEGYWCEVGHWSSDADAIHQMLEEKNLA